MMIGTPQQSNETKLRYSTIATYLKYGSQGLIRESPSEDDIKAIRMGNLIENILFDTYSDDKYIIDNTLKPAPAIKEIIDTLYNRDKDFNDENLLEIAKELKYQSNWKDATILEKLNAQKEYYDFIVKATGKLIITTDEYRLAQQCSDSIKNSSKTSHLFLHTTEEVKQQLYIEAQIEGFPCIIHGTLDYILINHENKTIQPIDLKTGFIHPEKFDQTIFSNKYYIQAAIYVKLIQSYISKIEALKDYTVLDFQFLYIGTMYPTLPVLWTFPMELVDKVLYKGCKYKNSVIKPMTEIVQEILWHKSNDIYNYSIDYVRNNSFEFKLEDIESE